MKSVQSEEELSTSVRKGECQPFWTSGVGRCPRRAASVTAMSIPAHLSRLRQAGERAGRLKETRRRSTPSRRQAPTESSPIGDNIEGFTSPRGYLDRGGKESKRLTSRTKSSGRDGQVSGEIDNIGDCFRKTAMPNLVRSEGSINENQCVEGQTVTIYQKDEKPLLAETEAFHKFETTGEVLIGRDQHLEESPLVVRKRYRPSVLLWSVTFTLALLFYFLVFSYIYRTEPVYTSLINILGLEEDIPPPPPTFKQQITDLLISLNETLNHFHTSLLEIIR